eukprot:EG_transcript_2658
MGIQLGFATFLSEQVDLADAPWGRRVDLAEEGAAGSVLIVDGNNVMHHLYRGSGLDGVFGGQPAAFEAEVLRWAEALLGFGVALWVVFDGVFPPQKQDTVVDRTVQRLQNWEHVAAGCSAEQLDFRPAPDNVVSVAKSALRRLQRSEREKTRARLRLYFALEEADAMAADLCRATPAALGVLSADTDFLFYEGCALLPLRQFDAQQGRGVALDAPTVAAELGLAREVYPLLPCVAGCDYLMQHREVLLSLHRQLVSQCYGRNVPPELSFSQVRLRSVLHFLRRKKRPEAVFQAVRSLIPGIDGSSLVDSMRDVVKSYAAPNPPPNPHTGRLAPPPLEEVEAADSWEDLSDAEPEAEPVASAGTAPFPLSAAPPHPFAFKFVDLPQSLLVRLVEGLHDGYNASAISLLDRRQYITVPFLEVLTKTKTPAETTASLLACADSKLALLRRALYGLAFAAGPAATVREVVRVPDGVEEYAGVAPLRGLGLPAARELLEYDDEARWRWLMTLLGLEAIPLKATTPAALPLAAFFAVCAHYPIPPATAEAWLCAALCPRHEGSAAPESHPRLGRAPGGTSGPTASPLQGYSPRQASLPALHSHYLHLMALFTTVLNLTCQSYMCFDSVVYRCLLSDPSQASTLPWYGEVQQWLPERLKAVDYHDGLRARLPAGELDMAVADLVAREAAGWERLREAEAPITGTVTYVHRRAGEPPFAKVQFSLRANSEPQTKRLSTRDLPGAGFDVRRESPTMVARTAGEPLGGMATIWTASPVRISCLCLKCGTEEVPVPVVALCLWQFHARCIVRFASFSLCLCHTLPAPIAHPCRPH